ncbi:MAG: hypothetical protein JO265_13025 [Acidimicrobiia bacterium]|nr:hypothetical protein [Acidimicrobiia bacterium]
MATGGVEARAGRQSAPRRDRLLALLDRAVHRRLTLVVAPAGYGKTTLLADWARTHAPGTVAWLTLEPAHNSLQRFAADMTVAVRGLDGGPSAVLVVDDFQQLTDRSVLDACAVIVERAPAALHFVLASRVEPPPRYYRLGLSDALSEIGARELACTPEEATDLVLPAQVGTAMARTNGWAFGLERFTDGRRVDDYLMAEVLNLQPDHVRTFLLSTSVLDRMTAPLCDFIISNRGSQITLEDLETSGAFVSSLDARREWFEYHPMLRSLLRRLLHQLDDARENELLHRAADWHLQRGDVESGVRYLIEAGADDEVVEAAFTHGPAMLEHHRTSEVAGWVERTRSASGRSQASVALLEAGALLFGDELAGVRDLLDTVEAMPGASPGERIVGDLLRAFFEVEEGCRFETVAAADRVLAAAESVEDAELPNLFGLTCSRRDIKAGARVARAVALMYDADLSAARRDLEAMDEAAHGIWRSSALGALALIEAWSGNLKRGEELARRALLLAGSLGQDDRARTTAWLALALVARERADLERAATILEDVLWAGGTQQRAVAVWVATEQALIALASDVPPAGVAALGGCLVSAHPSLPAGVLARRSAAHAQVLLASGDIAAAQEVAAVGVRGGSVELTAVRVRLALERGDIDQAHLLVASWPEEPQPRAGRERQLWRAILDYLGGDEPAACSAMAAVIAEAETEGDLGLFRAAGRYALGPARAVYRSAPTAFLRAVVDQLVIEGQPMPSTGLAERLTSREYMVLLRLPSRASNTEIAAHLGVSLNTVKTHLKHIYRKLDVVGRREAIDAAERLHLI